MSPKKSIEEPLMLCIDSEENSGLKTVHQQVYGYKATAFLVPSNHPNDLTLQQEIEERRRRRQTEETSFVTNIVFFLLCLLILGIIIGIVWFRFIKPKEDFSVKKQALT